MKGKLLTAALLAIAAILTLSPGVANATVTGGMSNWYLLNSAGTAWYQEPGLTTSGTPGTMDVADYGTIGTSAFTILGTPGAITYEGTGTLTLNGNTTMGAKNGTTPTAPYQYIGYNGSTNYNPYSSVTSGGICLSSTGTIILNGNINTASSYVDPVLYGPVGSTIIYEPNSNSGEQFDVGSGVLGKPVTVNGGVTVEIAPNRQSLTDTSSVTLNNGSTLEFGSTFVGNPVVGAVVTGNADAFTLQAYSYSTNVQTAFQNTTTAYTGNGQLAMAAPGMTETWGGITYHVYGVVVMPIAQYKVTGTTTINAYNALNISAGGTLTNANFDLTGQGNSTTPSLFVLNGNVNFTGTTMVTGTGKFNVDNGTYNSNTNDSQGGGFGTALGVSTNVGTTPYLATFTGAGARLAVGDSAVYVGTNKLTVSGNLDFESGATLAFNVLGDTGGASPTAGTDFSQLVMTSVGGALTGLANANLEIDIAPGVTQFTGVEYTFVTGSSTNFASLSFAHITVDQNGTAVAGATVTPDYENGYIGMTISTTPEPATMCLLALGGLGMMLRNRRR